MIGCLHALDRKHRLSKRDLCCPGVFAGFSWNFLPVDEGQKPLRWCRPSQQLGCWNDFWWDLRQHQQNLGEAEGGVPLGWCPCAHGHSQHTALPFRWQAGKNQSASFSLLVCNCFYHLSGFLHVELPNKNLCYTSGINIFYWYSYVLWSNSIIKMQDN